MKSTMVSKEEMKKKMEKEDSALLSVFARALTFQKERKVFLNPDEQTFTIHEGSVPIKVRIFPDLYCDFCKSSDICSHTVAAEISVGIRDERTKKPPNASLYRKRGRNPQVKSGKKKPYKDNTKTSKTKKQKVLTSNIII